MNTVSTQRRQLPAWYAVHVRPHKEQPVAQALHEQLGVGVFLPQVRQLSHGKPQISPFFPCYLFVRADLSRTAASAINTTPGVVRLVSNGGAPQVIAPAVIDQLVQAVAELNDRGGIADPRLYPGAPVRLRSGPLRGLEGAFVGPTSPSQRVRVLIEFLGSLRETEVPASAVEPLGGTPPSPPRERRTRGGGRRIAQRRLVP